MIKSEAAAARLMAICLLSLLPTVILVGLLQRYVVEGLSAGAVKG